jgi:hypothetical protein
MSPPLISVLRCLADDYASGKAITHGELVAALLEAARRIDFLENLAIQDSAARDKLRDKAYEREMRQGEYDHLRRQYAEVCHYRDQLTRERDALVVEVNKQDARIDALEQCIQWLEGAVDDGEADRP